MSQYHFGAATPRWTKPATRQSMPVSGAAIRSQLLGLDRSRETVPVWRAAGDAAEEGQTLAGIGACYVLTSQLPKALEAFNQALSISRTVGNRWLESSVLNNMGLTYRMSGDLPKALDHYGQALPLIRAHGDRRLEAVVLNNIGRAYESLAEHQKAVEYYSQSLALRRAVGDQAGEALSLSTLAQVYNAQGETLKALESHLQALPLRRASGDRRGEANVLHNIGAIYSWLADAQKALEYYTQALPLRRASRDRQGEAMTLSGRGGIYLRSGDLQKALEHYTQALALNRAAGDRRAKNGMLRGIGLAYDALGEKQKALDYFDQALASSRAVGNRADEAITLRSIGAVYGSMGEREKALEYYAQALPLHQATGDRASEAVTLAYLARAERDRGRLAEARTYIEASLAIIESLRSNVSSQELRATWLASKQSYYEAYIDVLLQQHQSQPAAGHDALALHASERAHARSLLELLAESHIDIEQGVDPELKQRERATQARLSWIQNQLIQTHSQAKPDQKQIAALEAELKTVDDERAQLEMEVRRKHPRYAGLQYPQPLGLNAIQGLLGTQTALLEYSLGQEASYLFAVTRDGFRAARLPSASALRERVLKCWCLPGVQERPKPIRAACRTLLGGTPSAIRHRQSAEDGLLQVYEIFNLKMNADLVLLSACETGLGQEVRGEGLIGLTRAFLYAGTPSVVVSLWKGNDRSTADLMVRFYRHWKGGKLSKAEALRQAQLEMVRAGTFAHPFHWAPFVLVGEGH